MAHPIEVNGNQCSSLSVHYPGHGIGVFSLKAPLLKKTPTGALGITVKYDGLTILGTLVSTFEYHDGIELRGCFGAYGWGKTTPPISFGDPSGVKLSTLLSALEKATGETFDKKPETRLGTHFVHQAGPAIWALTQVSKSWFVDPNGKTKLGAWAESKVTKPFEMVNASEPGRTASIAANDLTQWLPGASFESTKYGKGKVESVTHIISPAEYRAHITLARDNV